MSLHEIERLRAEIDRLRKATAAAEELARAVESHVHDLVKHYQPAPFMDGSRRVPPSIERLLRYLETALAAFRAAQGGVS